MDPGGRIAWVNDNWQRALGASRYELQGVLFPNLVHPDDAARTIDSLRALTESDDRTELENRCRANDGSHRLLSWRMVLTGGVVLAAGTDITQRNVDEQELRRLTEVTAQRSAELAVINEELEALHYSVSHDLRAPLRAIDGFTAVVARQYEDRLDDSGREMLERVRNAVARMNAMIAAMLVLSRLSRQKLRCERVDLSELAREVAATLREGDPQRRVDLVVADGLAAVGDRDLLRVVLENLLGNAWKFTANRVDARIEFKCEHQDGSRGFVVLDNGAGFEMVHADMLFAPFQRQHREDEFPESPRCRC